MSEIKQTEAAPELLTAEDWKAVRGTSDFSFAGAKALKKWANGRQMTGEDYDAGIAAFEGIKIK